jgi:hypothetical protein
MSPFPLLVRSVSPSGEVRYALGDPFVDRYLEFVAGRCRPNTSTVAESLVRNATTVRTRPLPTMRSWRSRATSPGAATWFGPFGSLADADCRPTGGDWWIEA